MAEKDKKLTKTASVANYKKEAIQTAMKNIEKIYGKGSIMRLGDQTNLNVEVIPTGSLALDLALGIGGVPRGRIIEIYGPESSGKTTLALHVVAEAQKRGGEVAFVDAEHALDPTYARALGVNIDDMLISQPDTGEQALEITEALVRSGALDVVVVDSVAALTPRAEIEGDMGGVRHHVRRGHQPAGRAAGSGREAGSGAEVRVLVLHGGDAAGPGPGRRQAVPQGQPGGGRQSGGRHPPGLLQAHEHPVPGGRPRGGPCGGRVRRGL